MEKIGYQGIQGSNSEEAAKQFAQKLQIENVEYVPLISSKNVIENLQQGNIDYGVVAIRNSYAGEVIETKEAIGKSEKKFECLQKLKLEIHHSIFKKNKNIKNEDLKIIASHSQALMQTKNFLRENLPNLHQQEVEDTALSAKYLAEGKFDETVAIICRKNAGEIYGLELMYENVEDKKDNLTEFAIYKMKNEAIFEKCLPLYLENDLERLKNGIQQNVNYIDCLINELQSSINSAFTDGDITEQQCDYLYKKYINNERE